MNDTIASLRDKLKQLRALRDSGTMDATAYESARVQLERAVVDRVLADGDASRPKADGPRLSKRLVSVLAALVLLVAGAGYWWAGSPSLPSAPMPSAADAAALPGAAGVGPVPPPSAAEQQFAAAAEQLAKKLKDQPDNAEGWAMLARSYARLDRLEEAVPAYAKAVALRGDDARLLVDYADTLAVTNNRSLAGEPTRLIERALKIDPNNVKALALAGTAAFDRKDFASAVGYWEKLVQGAPADAAFVAQVQAGIAEARQLGGLAPAAPLVNSVPVVGAGSTDSAAASPVAASAVATAGSAAIRGMVRLAPDLAKLASPDDTVFIYARAAEGPRMPLAILRKQVKDLPIAFSLDDSMAMSPAARLSMFAKVVVTARISKSGQAAPSSGDLAGQSAPVSPGAAGVAIVINEVVKN